MKQRKPCSLNRDEGPDLSAIYSLLLGIRNKFSDRQPNRFFYIADEVRGIRTKWTVIFSIDVRLFGQRPVSENSFTIAGKDVLKSVN